MQTLTSLLNSHVLCLEFVSDLCLSLKDNTTVKHAGSSCMGFPALSYWNADNLQCLLIQRFSLWATSSEFAATSEGLISVIPLTTFAVCSGQLPA